MTITKLTGWLAALMLLGSGCREEGKEPAKTVTGAGNLFLDYQVWGDEDRGQVNVLLQVRRKDMRGETVKLEAPGFVKLDGRALQPDSSGMTGYFYEAQEPLERFAGPHTITLSDGTGKEVAEEFEFTPFSLAAPIKQREGRNNLVLQLSGLKKEDRLRVTLVDTVFRTQDINDIMPVVNGRLHITPEQLQDVTTGPVTLLLYKEEERPISNPAVRGGKLAVTYGLTRDFELADR